MGDSVGGDRQMSKLLHAEVCHFRLVNTMRIPEYFLTPFSFWAHNSCHNVLNCHFILFGGASWVSWVLYGIMGIMDRPQVVHRKHPLAPNDHDLLGYGSIRSIHGMEKLPLCTVVTLNWVDSDSILVEKTWENRWRAGPIYGHFVSKDFVSFGPGSPWGWRGWPESMFFFFHIFFVPKGRDRNSGCKPSSETVALVFSMCLMCFFLYSLSECIVWLCHRCAVLCASQF